MSIEGHDCWEDCDEGPHGCVCGNDCPPSIRDYTPTTEAIRGRIIQRGIGWGFYGLDEFDRWLAAHDAAKRAEWEAEQGDYYEGSAEVVAVLNVVSGPRPITDEMLGIMAQAFFEATGTPGSGIRYTRMIVKPEIVAGLRAALEAAEEARDQARAPKARRRPCPTKCPCICHDTGGSFHDHEGAPCPGKAAERARR